MVEQENVDTQSVAIVGIFGAIVTFVLILGVQVLYYRLMRTDYLKKVVAPGCAELHEMVSEQQGSIQSYKWADRSKQVVTIPIATAMDAVVEDLKATRR